MNILDNLDLLFLILTGQVSSTVNRALARELKVKKIDITLEQFLVMAYLWKNEGVTQQELCTQTNKDKPNMTRLIDCLEKMDLVKRVADKGDRRVNLIFLTQNGHAVEKLAIETAVSVIKQGLKGLTEEQLETCRMVLKTVLNNIG